MSEIPPSVPGKTLKKLEVRATLPAMPWTVTTFSALKKVALPLPLPLLTAIVEKIGKLPAME